MNTDTDLLRRYVQNRDEPAFTELVQRHLGLVYSVALRRVGGARATYASPEQLMAAFTAKAIPVGDAQLVWQQQAGPDDAVACACVGVGLSTQTRELGGAK